MIAGWPRAWPGTGAIAVFKAQAEDFRVTELPAVEPSGSGEHLYLHIEKTAQATPAVAAFLARAFAVAPTAVGYAGMKDKHAVASQWFSVHTPLHAEALPPQPGLRLLGAARHERKLRRGDLAGNRFRVRLRVVDGDGWDSRFAEIRVHGVANYFGPQRFGGDNLARARAWLAERRRRRVSTFRAGLYLSVIRSLLFNEVLAARVRAGTWRDLIPGDVASASRTDVPTGPLWGRGRSAAAADALSVERAALAPHAALCEALEHAGPVQQRRALVLAAPDLTWQQDGDDVHVEFSLPPGGYATTLLAEVFELRRAETCR
jgi:tRNA pseudouridine13 synthase